MIKTKARNKIGTKGVSTVFGSILFVIIIITLASTLFLSLYNYNQTIQDAVIAEQNLTQEKMVIDQIQTDGEKIYITAIRVNNVGSVAIRIRSFYVDNTWIFDPDTNIDAKEQALIQMPPQTPYISTSIISVASERGMKSSVREGDLVEIYQTPMKIDFYFGPLRLDFDKFYYIECNIDGTYNPLALKDGWHPPASTNVVWEITVQNIDDRIISLNELSCLTLVPNNGGAQRPWYIEKVIHEDGTNSYSIIPQETVSIIYRWDTPTSKKPSSTFSDAGQNRVFLTFYGAFNYPDGNAHPYGQTIPFEAVLITK